MGSAAGSGGTRSWTTSARPSYDRTPQVRESGPLESTFTMKNATVFRGKCENGHEFAAPGLPDGSYGEFILTSDRNGDAAYLDAMSDETFDEVARFVRDRRTPPKDELQRGALVQQIFSATCDLADDGSSYRIEGRPRCTTCGSRVLREWFPTNPPVRVEVPPVTHEGWKRLRGEERRRILEEAAQAGSAR